MSPFEQLRGDPDVRTFGAGETIFKEGDPGKHMFAVLDGDVDIRKNDRVLECVRAGGVFGEMALIDKQPRSASAVAHSACRVVAVSETRFLFLVEQTPTFALQLLRVVVDRLRRASGSAT